jgi:hypothetical protein
MVANNISSSYIQDLKNRYSLYLTAEAQILNGAQEYTIGDRTLKRADLGFIAKTLKDISNEIAKAEAGGGIRVKRIIPRFDC